MPGYSARMGRYYLVRHGQASFTAANYDQLSDLGQRQCQQLGRHWAALGVRFDAVLCGPLRRHAQSLQAIGQGLGQDLSAQVCEGLREYDPHAVVAAVGAALPARDHPDFYRQYIRALRQGLAAWFAGQAQPSGLPDWPAFGQGVLDALRQALPQAQAPQGRVLVVTSGGPIAAALSMLWQTPPPATVELNVQLCNASVSELVAAPRRALAVHSFNTVAHLQAPGFEDWISYV
ncbi:MAG: histidine phosphatase family protein [Rhodoferax sp.]